MKHSRIPHSRAGLSLTRVAVATIVSFAGMLVLFIGRPMTDLEIGQGIIVFTLMCTGPFFIGFATEPDALHRPDEVASRTRHPWYAFVLYPGGSRGLILLFLSLVWLFGCHLFGHMTASGSMFIASEDTTQLAMLCLYSWIYVALPSTLLVSLFRGRLGKWTVRRLLVLGVFLSWLLAFPVGLLFGDLGANALCPFELTEQVRRNGEIIGVNKQNFTAVWIVAAIALILSLPRMRRGVGEVKSTPRA